MHSKRLTALALSFLMGNAVFASGVVNCCFAAGNVCDDVCTVVDEVDTVRVLPQTQVNARAVRPLKMSAQSTQTIDETSISRLGLSNVGQALSRMAGTQVRDYGGVGGMKTVSVHSLGASHTGVSYDGLPVSDCQAGQVDVGRFFIDNLSEISLTIGHEDDMLQSATGMFSAAVLRLSAAKPHFADSTARHALRATVKAGSWGELSPSLRYAYRMANNDMLTVNAAYQRADGHYPFTLSNGDKPLHYKRANTDIESGMTELNWSGKPWNGAALAAKVYGYTSERGLPGTAIYYNNVSRQRLWDSNAFAQAVLTQAIGTRVTLKGRIKYNYAYNRYEDTDSKYPGGMKRDRYQQHEGYVSATAMWHATNALDVSLAEDVRLNTLEMKMGTTRYEPNPTRLTSLTSLQARYTLRHLSMNVGALFTAASETVEKGTAMPTPTRLSPIVALSWRPWLQHRMFLRAMYRDTYRLPSFNDLYYDRIGNTELRPERADEWSVGMVCERESGNVSLSVTADGYLHRVTDKIVAMPGVYVWKMQNYGKVHISGVDVTANARWQMATGYMFEATGAYTYQRAIDRSDARRVGYGNQLPYTPRHSGNISATIEMPWVSASWNMQAMGCRYALAATTAENEIKAFVVHDINMWHTFHVGRVSLRLQASLCNIANRQYDIIRYYPMPGRHARVTLTCTM